MSNLPPEPPKPALDPAIIDRAPIEPEQQDFSEDESGYFLEMVGQLSAQVEALEAENERLKGKKTFDDVRADMMQPYANKVFRFLVGYCVFVAAIILLDGFKVCTFDVSDAVLGIIAGSTAVAAIGLVGFVVSGLFGVKSKEG